MIRAFFWGILVFFIAGCNHKNPQPPQDNQDHKEQKEPPFFFPVTSFIKGEMRQFDSLQVNPLYTRTIKEKTDTIWLKVEQLKPMLQVFLTPQIDSAYLASYFKETRFNDRTLNLITFTYDPLDNKIADSFQLRTCNVYVDPETGNVTKIYLVKKVKENNQLITYQLTWQAGKSAWVNMILNKKDGETELLKEEKIAWDLTE